MILVPVLGVIPVRADRQRGKDELGERRWSILQRRVDELIVEPVDSQLLQQIVSRHARPVAGHEVRVVEAFGAARRARGGREEMRVLPVEVVTPHDEMILRRELIISSAERVMLERVGWQGNRVAAVDRRADHDRVRFALVFVREEVVHPILDDRSAERRADLLVRIRQHLAGVGVGGVQLVAAEIAVRAAVVAVAAGLRDRLHLHPDRTAHRDVEHVRDDLVLGDCVAADARLTESGD